MGTYVSMISNMFELAHLSNSATLIVFCWPSVRQWLLFTKHHLWNY